MKQDKTGRHYVVLTIDPLFMRIGAHGVELMSEGVFMMEVYFYYEDAIRSCEDDPGAEEYVEIISARVFRPLELSCEGLTLLVEPTVNLLDLISDNQYEQLVDLVLKEKFNGEKCYGA